MTQDNQHNELLSQLSELISSYDLPLLLRNHGTYLNPGFAKYLKLLGVRNCFVKGDGILLTDSAGKSFYDFTSGYGALPFGHEPKDLLAVLHAVDGSPNLLPLAPNVYTVVLAELLAKKCPGDLSRSFFCNSGAEAVEAGLKLARAATKKPVLLYASNAYHGKTFGALSVTGRKKYRQPFEPLLPAVEEIPFGDSARLESRLSQRDVAGFIVEPIQGEGGVVVPAEGYLKQCELLCRKHGALLILDEIQTGLGRTGELFAFQAEQVEPDVLLLSKALGGGVMPIGAMVTSAKIWDSAYGSMMNSMLHSSTFSGNTRACALGIASLLKIENEGLCAQVKELGDYLLRGLREIAKSSTLVQEVRGRGLMLGVEFKAPSVLPFVGKDGAALWVARKLFRKHQVLTGATLNSFSVLRVAPPLTATRGDIDYFLRAVATVVS